MAFDPEHGHAALRSGRWSESGADYFLTFCTLNRQAGLNDAVIQQSIWSEIAKMENESAWHVRTATIMPDHLHLLITLGEGFGLAEVVRL
jgi:REP element-mobilizing transposase RayT